MASIALVVGALGPVGIACEPPCEQPFRPVAAEDVPNGGPFVGPWPVTGTPRPPVTRPLDTDGDGVTDTAERTDARTLVVHRWTGDLVLTAPAAAAIGSDPQYGDITVGDVDGDGRSDLYLLQSEPQADGTSTYTPYLISGATPDGAHAVADVGARLWPTGARRWLGPVGDVDGDGHDDLAGEDEGTADGVEVWSGAELDLTPGTAVTAPPTYEPPGHYEASVPLDGRDALVLQTIVDTSGTAEILLWLPEVTLRFTTEADGIDPSALAYVGPEVVGEGDDTWLTVTYIYRTIAQRWAWDLDDLCAATPV